VSRPPKPTEPERGPAERDLTRREALRALGWLAAAVTLAPGELAGVSPSRDAARLDDWTRTLRREGLVRCDAPGRAAARVGELAAGSPYTPGTLDAYLAGGSRRSTEPLTLSLSRFDCVTLVESCLAVARVAHEPGGPSWRRFGEAIERMRYRGGHRGNYASRLHYFSEWMRDGERRGLVHCLGRELGGVPDERPLRFMSEHRSRYRALADERVFGEISVIERRLDAEPRLVVPTKRIPQIVDRLETGDVVAFATEIPGLDVTHSAFAYRDQGGTLRVLHAPLSGGSVEVTRSTLPEYVAAIRRATGILVARPSWS
jgi:hypothetical protein